MLRLDLQSLEERLEMPPAIDRLAFDLDSSMQAHSFTVIRRYV
jgi:hypothetical protein